MIRTLQRVSPWAVSLQKSRRYRRIRKGSESWENRVDRGTPWVRSVAHLDNKCEEWADGGTENGLIDLRLPSVTAVWKCMSGLSQEGLHGWLMCWLSWWASHLSMAPSQMVWPSLPWRRRLWGNALLLEPFLPWNEALVTEQQPGLESFSRSKGLAFHPSWPQLIFKSPEKNYRASSQSDRIMGLHSLGGQAGGSRDWAGNPAGCCIWSHKGTSIWVIYWAWDCSCFSICKLRFL